jgi:hypothetical protein
VAAAATVPAPGGTGALDALGAIVAATVTLAAGGGTVGHHHRASAQGPEAAAPAIAAPFATPSAAMSTTLGAPGTSAKHVRVRTRRATSLTAPVSSPDTVTAPALLPVPAAPVAPAPIVPAPAAGPALPAQPAPPAAAPADSGVAATTTLAQTPGTVSANTLTGGRSSGPFPAGTTGAQGPVATTQAGQKPSGPGSAPATGKPVAAPKAPKVAAPKQPAAPKLPAQPKTAKPAKGAPMQATKASGTT